MAAAPLADRVALVTGGSRGIGRAVVLCLAGLGARVIINYRENHAAAEEVLEAVLSDNGRAELAPFDVGRADEVEAAVKGIIDGHEKLDILINNAGVTGDGLLLRQSSPDWDRIIDVNLRGLFHCTKAAARRMIRQRYGRIVNLTSVAGQMGNVGQSVYAASKAGIEGFTKSMARELAPRGITVNAVAPGFIETEMTASLNEETRGRYLEAIPLGRFGGGDDVARTVAFLAGPGGEYITGQTIAVNGGLYM
ncbi:MAG: 3-oxoacyl-[acyl-carrier-protein] reductase [Deltaproteobacteria bacterium]|nr:3-oxoacyl-[acyl-carrier-protein] reductase [Deltaproteobacteria bacterium]